MLGLPPWSVFAAMNTLYRLFIFLLLASACLDFARSEACAAPSASQLEKNLAKEQERATARRTTLRRLTEEERKIDKGLAQAEARILELESGIENHRKKLVELARTDSKAREEYEVLLAKQAATEKALAETLHLLWEVTAKRLAVGSRDMLDWAETDREYAWSSRLYASLEQHRKQLDSQETQLIEVLGRREKLALQIQSRLSTVNDEKQRLLQNRIAYEQKLADVRRQKVDTETELTRILSLVENLNLQLTETGGGDFGTLKGRLPWPVKGKVRQKYAPTATEPFRGWGFAADDGTEVFAVAAGKVVHNNLLRGFGTVLILRHGEDYYSLYAFLGDSPLKVGEDVTSRRRIGTCGYYPAAGGAGLYFELRFKQKAINPEQWLAAS